MIKIVLDTNTLIDGSSDDYNFNNRIIDEVLAGRLEAFANRQTLSENRLMVRRKITDETYLDKVFRFFDTVAEIERNNPLDVVEDYDDNKILESAVDSGADYLVTSDNHLLKLESHDQVKIVTPQQFWSIYEQETGSAWKNWLHDFIH